jgi:hypothetical protein
MKRIAIAVATTAALLASPALFAKERISGEEKLARMLDGRVAGEPVKCVPYGQSDEMKIIDKTAIVFGRGETIYVNRPTNADSLDDDDVLVRRSHTARVCNLDIVQLLDQTSKMYTGTVGLSEFVPYRKVAYAD